MSAHGTEAAQRLLRGLDVEAIDIASNPLYYERLEDFAQQYVAPERFYIDETEVRHTTFSVIGGLEIGGMMMNVRQRQTVAGKVSFDPNNFYAVAVGWLDSEKVPEFRFTPSRTQQDDAGKLLHMELLLDGSWSERAAKTDDQQSLTPHELAEILLERQRSHQMQFQQTTRLVVTPQGRWLHLPGHVVHRLKSFDETLGRVRLARERGFGQSVMEHITVTE